MKKKILSFMLAIFCVMGCVFSFVGCGGPAYTVKDEVTWNYALNLQNYTSVSYEVYRNGEFYEYVAYDGVNLYYKYMLSNDIYYNIYFKKADGTFVLYKKNGNSWKYDKNPTSEGNQQVITNLLDFVAYTGCGYSYFTYNKESKKYEGECHDFSEIYTDAKISIVNGQFMELSYVDNDEPWLYTISYEDVSDIIQPILNTIQ